MMRKRIKQLAILLIQIVVSVTTILGISIVFYTIWYRNIVPKVGFVERVYFDFAQEHPHAAISLICPENQWDKMNDANRSCNSKSGELIAGNYYDFSAIIKLSKSSRNIELAKSSLVTKIIDMNDQTVAKSVRPLIIPFQSWLSLQMETVLLFPFRVLRYIPMDEFVSVEVSLIENYQESLRSGRLSKASKIEFEIHNGDLDVQDFHFKITPRLSYISYWLLHYPILSFVCGISIITTLQVIIYGTIILVALAYSTLSANDILKERRPILEEGVTFHPTSEFVENESILDTTAFTWRIDSGRNNFQDIPQSTESESEEDSTSFVWRKKNN